MPPRSTSANLDTQADSATLDLGFTVPWTGRKWISHGFVGAWTRALGLRVRDDERDTALRGDRWFLLAASEAGAGDRCHHDADRGLAVAFDGYVVDPPLHQRSASSQITAFWAQQAHTRVNGNFAAAVVDEPGQTLTLRTDAFGFAPLYYRDLGDVVLFATCADYLVDADAQLDTTSLLSVVNNGIIAGDRSLFTDIRRVPLGGCLTFAVTGEPVALPLHLEVTGTGSQPLTPGRMEHIEESFREAVRRCLALEYGSPVIALSSGHDSRRILGALLDAGQRPAALTVRVFQKGGRDLDATYGRQLAEACHLDHRVIDLPDAATAARDNDLRRQALGAETPMHDWSLILQRAYPAEPAAIFKGFLGDTLQEPDYRFEGVFERPQEDLERVATIFADNPCAAMLLPALGSGSDVAAVVRTYLAPYAGLPHAADLASMALRMRRAVAAGTQLVQPRHLEVRPFLDLDFIQAVLDIDPRAKLGCDLRRDCLERFYPALARFRGSAIEPKSLPPVARTGAVARERAYVARIARDLPVRTQQQRFARLLSPRGRALATLTRVAPRATQRWYWALRPLLEAALHPDRTPPVWHRD